MRQLALLGLPVLSLLALAAVLRASGPPGGGVPAAPSDDGRAFVGAWTLEVADPVAGLCAPGRLDVGPDGRGGLAVQRTAPGTSLPALAGTGFVRDGALLVAFGAPGGVAGALEGLSARGPADVRAIYRAQDGALRGLVRVTAQDGARTFVEDRGVAVPSGTSPGAAGPGGSGPGATGPSGADQAGSAWRAGPSGGAGASPDGAGAPLTGPVPGDADGRPDEAPATTGGRGDAAGAAAAPGLAAAEDASDLPARIVRVARAARDLGWEGGPPERQDAYARLLFPHDTEAHQRQFAGHMSSCGLFAMACLRGAGLPHPSLDGPYARQIGRAVTNIVTIAREHGAWVDAGRRGERSPRPGDMVLVGSSVDAADWGGVEHVLVVVAREGDDVVSVDGGQAGKSIRERRRRLEAARGGLWLRSLDGPGARRVQGWLDAAALRPGR